MMAVTAVTSTMGLTADSQWGSSGRRYQIRYCATVQASTGPNSSTFAWLRAGDRCGAYMSADAVSRNTTAPLRPFSIRSALSRLRRRLGGGANEELAKNCINGIWLHRSGWGSRPTRYLLPPTPVWWCSPSSLPWMTNNDLRLHICEVLVSRLGPNYDNCAGRRAIRGRRNAPQRRAACRER